MIERRDGPTKPPDAGAPAALAPDQRLTRPRLGTGEQHVGALLLYVVLAAVLLWPALAGDQMVSAAARWARIGPFPAAERQDLPLGIDILSDSMNAYVPYLLYAADGFAKDHRIPLWKSTTCCGVPFVGNGESAVYFPTNLLAILLGAPHWIHAAIAFLKLLTGAFCAYLLARHLRLSWLGSVLVGLVFGIGGFQMVFLLYTPGNVAMLLPLLLLLVDRAVLRPTLPRLGAVALVAGLQHLAGHPETTVHCQALAFVLGAVRLGTLRAELGGRQALRRGALLAAAFVVGALGGAVQVLPLIEYIRGSDTLLLRRRRLDRLLLEHTVPALLFVAALGAAIFAAVRLARARRRLLAWALLLLVSVTGALVAGLAAGMPTSFVLPLAADWFGTVTRYAGPENYLERNGAYAGAALALAVAGLLFGRPRGLARTAGVLLVLGLAAGFRAPVVFSTLHLLPLFHIAENTRLLLVAQLATAVLAGLGLDALGRVAADRSARLRYVLAGLAPALGAVGAIALGMWSGLCVRGDVPPLPPGTPTVDAQLLPLELEGRVPPPGFAEPSDVPLPPGHPHVPFAPASGQAVPQREILGLTLLSAPPAGGIRVLYGTQSRSVPASWVELGEAGGPPLEGGQRRYAFRARIPRQELPPGPSSVRLRISQAGGVLQWSAPLQLQDERTPPLLGFPVLPMGVRSHVQLALLALAGALTAWLLRARRLLRDGGRLALVGVCAVSLWHFAWPLVPLLPARAFYPSSPALAVLQRLPPSGRMLAMVAQGFPPEIPSVYGIPDVRGYDALYPARVAALLREAADVKPRFTTMELLPARQDPDLGLLGLMAVQVLADWEQHPPELQPLRFLGEEKLPGSDPFPIVPNPQFLPRARLVSGAAVEPDDERALLALAAPDFPRASTVLLASGAAQPASAGEPGRAAIVTDRPEHVQVDVAPNQPGWLVLADTFYPGWEATVDGQPREVLRANVAFRAVPVRPGDRTVEFRYAPLWFRVGALITMLAGLLVLLALAAGARRPRPRAA